MMPKSLLIPFQGLRSTQRWALRYLFLLALVALFANFLANDRPLIARHEGVTYFPVFRQIGESWFNYSPYTHLPDRSWKEVSTDWAWWPLVPYAATGLDRANSNYRSPFGPQQVKSWRWRHHLGTDQLGRDVLAGLIWGSRTALLVGLVAMSLALLIGILVGSLGGYFGNDLIRSPRWRWWGGLLGTLIGLGYSLATLPYFLAGWSGWWQGGSFLVLICLFVVVLQQLFRLLGRFWSWWASPIFLPMDALSLRAIELFNAVPTLVLLIVILGLLKQPTILSVMVVIGLVRWTGIARFVRGELLKIRALPYIQAARLSGFSHFQVLIRHALPNALGPVLVAFAFGMAGAILLEAFLSFLGLGLSADQVSWGSILQQSRSKVAAWWLAVFPGLAIFLTVLSLNLVVEKR